MTSSTPYRSRAIADHVIAFSISFQRDNFLERGMGIDHLKELLQRLARYIVRQGANIAYGGNWKDAEDNFTYDLLRCVSSEQEDNSLGGPDTNLKIGKLYNHLSWPYYLDVTPRIEAQWINSSRIVRITQQQAGIAQAHVVTDDDFKAKPKEPRALFNTAVTTSAMRRMMMEEMLVDIPDVPTPERIPPVVARILLGGKVEHYPGFLPGIFEEALVTLENRRPTFILGGFGCAAEILANAMLMAPGSERPEHFMRSWHEANNENLQTLLKEGHGLVRPHGCRSTEELLDALFEFVENARADLKGTLNTWLSDEETRTLMTTRDIATAVKLVRTGLVNSNKLPTLAA